METLRFRNVLREFLFWEALWQASQASFYLFGFQFTVTRMESE